MVDAKGWVVGYVELNYEMNPFRAVVNYAQLAFLFAAAVAVVLAIPIGIISSRRITTPLMQLSDVAIRMSSGDFSVRAKIKGKDEIGILVEKFNQMAYRIEELFRQSNEDRDTLRRFISDASHELRTPLSALANSIELLQNAASSDPLARTKFLRICESQVQRLGWITGSLLDLSRMDAHNPELDWGTYQPLDLVTEAASAFEEQAKRKGIQIIIKNHEPEGKINCDRSRMIMALSNLIDNAVKFTDPDGLIKISVHMANDEITCKFRVQDTGTGIPATDLPQIFERFYRGRANQSQGCGLGLAIVESVAKIHGGNVTIESKFGECTVATISISRYQASILP